MGNFSTILLQFYFTCIAFTVLLNVYVFFTCSQLNKHVPELGNRATHYLYAFVMWIDKIKQVNQKSIDFQYYQRKSNGHNFWMKHTFGWPFFCYGKCDGAEIYQFHIYAKKLKNETKTLISIMSWFNGIYSHYSTQLPVYRHILFLLKFELMRNIENIYNIAHKTLLVSKVSKMGDN